MCPISNLLGEFLMGPGASQCPAGSSGALDIINRDTVMKRMRRLFAPRASGKYLLPAEVIAQWNDVEGGGRDALIDEFARCSFDKDRVSLGFRKEGHACISHCGPPLPRPASATRPRLSSDL